MGDLLDKKWIQIEEEKKRIRLRERLLVEKERQRRAKNCVEVGRIACRANIDNLDKQILLGAFLEIADRSCDEKTVKGWQEKAAIFSKNQDDKPRVLLSISFTNAPSKDIKDKLKSSDFRWNKFRQEFAGYGDKSAIEQLLVGHDCLIEVLP